jgi:hypothetical protein
MPSKGVLPAHERRVNINAVNNNKPSFLTAESSFTFLLIIASHLDFFGTEDIIFF